MRPSDVRVVRTTRRAASSSWGSSVLSLNDCVGHSTIYPGVDHYAYDLSAGHDVYAWLLEHEHAQAE